MIFFVDRTRRSPSCISSVTSQLYLQMGVGAVYTSTLAIQKLATPQNPPITQEDMLATALHPIVSFVVLNSIVVRASSLIILTSI